MKAGYTSAPVTAKHRDSDRYWRRVRGGEVKNISLRHEDRDEGFRWR